MKFGITQELKRKYFYRKVDKIMTAVVLGLAMPYFAALDSTPLIVILVTLFLAAVASLFFGNAPLKIYKFRRGEFWISGCSREFLDRLINTKQVS